MTDLAVDLELERRLTARLQLDNDTLRERVHQLEAIIADNAASIVPAELSATLTGAERTLLGALLSRPVLTKDGAMTVLYRNNSKDEPEIKIVDVFICKLRKKLKPYDIQITTLWGQGYTIDEANKRKLPRTTVGVADEEAQLREAS